MRAGIARGAMALLLAAAITACAGTPRSGEREDRSDAVVRFDIDVRDAEVWVDGQYVDGAIRRGLALAPGEHRIAIRHDDYHTRYLEITVSARERRTVRVELAEILP